MTARASSRPPKKIFHKISEVCEVTKTEPYVLRYWEKEFPFLAPEKNRAGQRIYTDDDIQMVMTIKKLLYDEGYTTAGARRRLAQEIAVRKGEAPPEAVPTATAPMPAAGPVPGTEPSTEAVGPDLVGALRSVRSRLIEVREQLASRTASEPSGREALPADEGTWAPPGRKPRRPLRERPGH